MEEKLRELKQRLQPGDKELLHTIVERIGDKWSMMVLVILAKKPRRFTELVETVPGVSRRMLTVTLRQLERDGLVERVVHADVPPWFEYQTTELGLSLRGPLAAIMEWSLDHRDEIVGNRARYDASQGS